MVFPYGLRIYDLRWHDKFYDCHRNIEFVISRAEPDIWMRLNIAYNIYKYIAVYVDDLAIAAKYYDVIISTLRDKYKFKLKGSCNMTYQL